MELKNTKAMLVGEIGAGVRTISLLFNVTRIYTAIGSAGGMRRMLFLVKDYAKKRQVFGRPLSEQPLHVTTIAHLERLSRATLHLGIHLGVLLGQSEYAQYNPKSLSSERKAEVDGLLRILTPLTKLFIAKKTVAFISEAMECFGGTGYMTDSGIPQALADTQVDAIWEGTTNVLSLDVLRALTTQPKTLEYFFKSVENCVKNSSSALSPSVKALHAGVHSVKDYLNFVRNQPQQQVESRARLFSFTLTRIYIAALLIHYATQTGKKLDIYTAKEWCRWEPLSMPSLSSFQDDESENHLEHSFVFFPSKL